MTILEIAKYFDIKHNEGILHIFKGEEITEISFKLTIKDFEWAIAREKHTFRSIFEEGII